MNKKIWLVGAGVMALDYVKVLSALGCNFEIIGRGKASADKLMEMSGIQVIQGGIRWALEQYQKPDFAIVATGIEALADSASALIKAGVKNILLEKPGGFYEEIDELASLARTFNANVHVAYNRRYYSSVLKARQIIEEDGGVTSFNFEFTEWAHTIEPLLKADGVKEQWLLANSSHVIDLAFYLGGFPAKMTSFKSGELQWHRNGSVFSGAGVSESGALFSYQANWTGPGRWVVEITTKKHRLIFKPMEKLQIQKIGSITVEPVEINDELDLMYKPGLFLEVKSFVNQDKQLIPDIYDQVRNAILYKQINFGTT